MPYEHRNLVMSGSSSMPKNWGWCAQSYFDAHRRKWFRTRKPVMVAHKQMPRSTSRMAVRCRFPTFLSIWGFLIYIYVHTHTHIYVYIYIWYTLSVCELKPIQWTSALGCPKSPGPTSPRNGGSSYARAGQILHPGSPILGVEGGSHMASMKIYHGYITNDDAKRREWIGRSLSIDWNPPTWLIKDIDLLVLRREWMGCWGLLRWWHY
jgi:hypothetical protein